MHDAQSKLLRFRSIALYGFCFLDVSPMRNNGTHLPADLLLVRILPVPRHGSSHGGHQVNVYLRSVNYFQTLKYSSQVRTEVHQSALAPLRPPDVLHPGDGEQHARPPVSVDVDRALRVPHGNGQRRQGERGQAPESRQYVSHQFLCYNAYFLCARL